MYKKPIIMDFYSASKSLLRSFTATLVDFNCPPILFLFASATISLMSIFALRIMVVSPFCWLYNSTNLPKCKYLF